MASDNYNLKEKRGAGSTGIVLSQVVDRLGLFFSSVCLVHCWIFPLVVAIFPTIPFAGEWLHPMLTAVAVGASVLLVVCNELIRRKIVLMGLLLTGNLCLIAGGWQIEWMSAPAETLLNTTGSLCLLTVHYNGFRRHKRKQYTH